MKKCPFCAEEIQDDAIKCRYCSEFLDSDAVLQKSHPIKKPNPWVYSNMGLVVGFLCVGPLILPLVWLNPRFDMKMKLFLSAVIFLLTWGLIALIWPLVQNIMNYYKYIFNELL